MKIFYVASALTDARDSVMKIYKHIEALGHSHTSDYVTRVELDEHKEAGREYWEKLYEREMGSLQKADVCILEVSTHSLGLGQLVQEAIRSEKPVILLSRRDCVRRELIDGACVREKRVQLLDYSEDDLVEVVDYGLEVARERLGIRFTMLLGPKYVRYLDVATKVNNTSRSEYLRRLIEKDAQSSGRGLV